MTAFISTPFGDFDYVQSDMSLGGTCRDCCLYGRGLCYFSDCDVFDHDGIYYHLRPHYEIGGAS